MGMPEAEVMAFAASIGLPERGPVECYLPTPLEIVKECAKIRDSWLPLEREMRRGGRLR